MMYEALSGHLPFDAESFNDLLFKIVLEDPPPLETLVSDVDREILGIIKKAMAREVDDRFADATDFATALTGWLKGQAMPTGTVAMSLPPELRAALSAAPGTFPSTGAGTAIVTPGAYPAVDDSPVRGDAPTSPASWPPRYPTGSNSAPTPTTGVPTQTTFGSSGAFAIAPAWWLDRRFQIGGGVALLVILMGIAFGAMGGSSEDDGVASEEQAEQEGEEAEAAARAREKEEADKAQAEAVEKPVAVEPVKVPEKPVEPEAPKPDPEPVAEKKPHTVSTPAPRPRPTPAPAPRADPAPRPSPKRPYFGY
jgi:serine/threonine-protein kinase